jgi:FHA domain
MTAVNATALVGYSPGGWVAMACPDIWLLADLDPNGILVRHWWELLRTGVDTDDLLDTIGQSGPGAVGNFALVRRLGETAHAVVRGIAQVEVVTRERGTVHIDTAGLTDQSDRLVTGSLTEIRLFGAGAITDQVQLPFAAGVVLAQALTVSLEACGSAPQDDRPYRPEAVGRPEVDVPAPPLEVRGPGPTAVPSAVPEVDPLEVDGAPRYGHMLGIADPPATAAAVSMITSESLWPEAAPEVHPPISPSPISPSPVMEPAPSRGIAETLPPPAEDDGMILSFPFTRPTEMSVRPQLVVEPREPSRPAVVSTSLDHDDDISVTTIRRRDPNARVSATAGPVVLAVRCITGHPNPVAAPACRVCNNPITDRVTQQIPRPVLGELHLSTGDTIVLERGIILGRAPDAPTGRGRDEPNIMRLLSPDNDISRNHLEVRIDGWRVLVADLGSTNGTFVAPKGGPYEKLAPHREMEIEPGAVVSLSEQITLRYEVTG